MSTSTTENAAQDSTTTDAPDNTESVAPVYEKGSWEHTLQLSVQAEDKSKSAKILAGKRLRAGAWSAVSEFIEDSANDPSGESLYARVKATGLSASSASKIKKVALTARDFPEYGWLEVPEGAPEGTLPKVSDPKMSLNKADQMARDLTDKPEAESAEDDAADAAIAAITEDAPASAKTPQAAIALALAKAGDVDEFVKVLIDVLNGPTGEHNEAACRAFIRSFAAENAGRVKAAKPAKPTVADKNAEKRAAATTKPVKPTPVSKSKGDPNNKALPPKAAQIDAAEAEANTEVDGDDDLWDAVDTETETAPAVVETKATPVKTKATPVKKATPIKRA